MYVAYVLNNCASSSLKDQTPLFVATGQVNDISPMLEFVFGEPVYYCLNEEDFPSDSRELLGNFVGISEHVGHKMTFKVLSNDTLLSIPSRVISVWMSLVPVARVLLSHSSAPAKTVLPTATP